MKRVTATIHHLPSSPASAAYNGLSLVQPKAPVKRLKRVDRSDQSRRPRALTDAQQVRLVHALEEALAAGGEDAGADTE